MSWKRRGRAVMVGALLAMTCLAAVPSTGGAYPIKWWVFPQLGEPDVPGSGTILIKLRGTTLLFAKLGSSTWILVPYSSRGATTRLSHATRGRR